MQLVLIHSDWCLKQLPRPELLLQKLIITYQVRNYTPDMKSEIYSRVNSSPTLDPNWSQLNPIYTSFTVSLISVLGLSQISGCCYLLR